jgi:hypothetical protein
MPRTNAKLKFVHITSSDGELFALDAEGGVWEYEFEEDAEGWKPLSDARFERDEDGDGN